MDITVPVAVVVLISVVTIMARKLINSLWLRPRKLEKSLRDQGFQGNPYRWISGDLSQIGHMAKSALSKPIDSLSHDIVPRIMPFVHHIVKKYGTKSFIWYGRRPRINVTEPEMIRKIFTEWEVYHKECPTVQGNFGLVMREGENWARVRRVLNPTFHVEKLKRLLPVMQLSCETMLKKWDEPVGVKGSTEVDVWSALKIMSSDVIARAAFGTSYKEGKKLFQLQDESVLLTFQMFRSVTNYIPRWRCMPTKLNRRKKEVDREIRAIVKNLIDQRKQSRSTGNNKDDLLGIMLESNEREMEAQGSTMTIDEVIEECKLFHIAGEETTAALLAWTMILLSQHQEWQSKAREEVLQRFGKDTLPDFESLNHLKIVSESHLKLLSLRPTGDCFSDKYPTFYVLQLGLNLGESNFFRLCRDC